MLFALLIVVTFLFIIYIVINKMNINLLYIPMLLLIPYIYFENILVINSFNYMLFVSLFLIMLIGFLIYYNKNNIFQILIFVYSILHILIFEQSKYVDLSIILFCAVAIYWVSSRIKKDLFLNYIVYYLRLRNSFLVICE